MTGESARSDAKPADSGSPRIAVIGCGYWGRNLIRVFKALGALEAICDVREKVARDVSAEFGVPALAAEEILDANVIQGIAVAAPAARHYEIAVGCLAAGKDVFVEKPLALDASHAEELCDLAEREDRVLMVGHLLQYHPAFVALKGIVEEKHMGQLRYAYSNRLNLGRFRQEEDILWSFAPHDISMILSLVGDEPDEVRAVGSYLLGSELADVTTTHLSFPRGQQGHVYVSWLHPYKEQRLVVVADEGMAVFDDGRTWEEKLLVYPHKISWTEGIPEPVRADAKPIKLTPAEPLTIECQHFLECMQSRATPRTSGREGLRVLKVLERAARSMQESKRVRSGGAAS